MNTTARPADPQLAAWSAELDAIERDVDALTTPLSDGQLTWRPAPGKWSIAECLEHLSLTAEQGMVYQRKAVAAARAAGRAGSGPFRFGWLGNWFVQAVGPAASRRVKTPSIFAPPSDLDPKAVVERFHRVHQDIRRLYLEADGLDLGRTKARSAATGLLRLNLAAWFASMPAHDRRHLGQMQRVRAHDAFPKA
ncbi:MAG: DinB family protein [Gemmatimonadales bacterium]